MNFEFPETLQEVTGLILYLQYTEFFGDSLNAMRLQVDTLNKVIPESDKRSFYTNLDPTEFIGHSCQAHCREGLCRRRQWHGCVRHPLHPLLYAEREAAHLAG